MKHRLNGLLVLLSISCLPNAVCAQTVSDGLGSASYTDIRKDMSTVPDKVREAMSKEQVTRYVTNMLMDRRVMEAAKAAGIPEQELVKAKIAKAVDDVIIRAYLDGEMIKLASTLPDFEKVAKERYLANQGAYVLPEAIRAAHILLRIDDDSTDPELATAAVRKKAESLVSQLKAGADFAKLAKENSQDVGSMGNGGELPDWQERGKLVPQFEAAAFALKPGQISAPVKTKFGYHIIKLLEYRPNTPMTFEDIKIPLMEKLRKEALAQRKDELLARFRGIKPVVIDDKTLDLIRKN